MALFRWTVVCSSLALCGQVEFRLNAFVLLAIAENSLHCRSISVSVGDELLPMLLDAVMLRLTYSE